MKALLILVLKILASFQRTNDIALLKLWEKIPYNEEIKVCEENSYLDYQLGVCGLGIMNEIDPITNVTTYKFPEVLKEVKLYESTNETCKNESFS